MEIENEIRQVEKNRLEAECRKLELEAKEIQGRLNARWWQSSTFAQYVVATVITTVLLFAWAKAFLEPYLDQQSRLNTVAEQHNRALNEFLEVKNKILVDKGDKLQADTKMLEKQRDGLQQEGASLKKERKALIEEREGLERVVTGLQVAIARVREGEGKEFFSILNSGDPIKKLASYGWTMSADNYFGQIGYYLVVRNQRVRGGKEIYVSRVLDVDRLKKEQPNDWSAYMELVTSKAPVIALDYTYFGLIADQRAPVGGVIYKQGGEVVNFRAPLSEWATALAGLL